MKSPFVFDDPRISLAGINAHPVLILVHACRLVVPAQSYNMANLVMQQQRLQVSCGLSGMRLKHPILLRLLPQLPREKADGGVRAIGSMQQQQHWRHRGGSHLRAVPAPDGHRVAPHAAEQQPQAEATIAPQQPQPSPQPSVPHRPAIKVARETAPSAQPPRNSAAVTSEIMQLISQGRRKSTWPQDLLSRSLELKGQKLEVRTARRQHHLESRLGESHNPATTMMSRLELVADTLPHSISDQQIATLLDGGAYREVAHHRGSSGSSGSSGSNSSNSSGKVQQGTTAKVPASAVKGKAIKRDPYLDMCLDLGLDLYTDLDLDLDAPPAGTRIGRHDKAGLEAYIAASEAEYYSQASYRQGTQKYREAAWDKLAFYAGEGHFIERLFGLQASYEHLGDSLLWALQAVARVDPFGNIVSAQATSNLSLGYFNIDHIVPHSRGGPTDTDNLIAMSARANSLKSHHLMVSCVSVKVTPTYSTSFYPDKS